MIRSLAIATVVALAALLLAAPLGAIAAHGTCTVDDRQGRDTLFVSVENYGHTVSVLYYGPDQNRCPDVEYETDDILLSFHRPRIGVFGRHMKVVMLLAVYRNPGPYLAVAGALLGWYPALAFVRGPLRRWRRRRRGLCVSCGYNLPGNESGVCPECGTNGETSDA